MKHFILAAGLWLIATTAFADVDVSINVGAPAFFGRIDIDGAPRPQLLFPRPVIITRVAPRVVVEPLYLHVPVAESRNWRRHCNKYNACDRQVYFVRDNWYRRVYVPHYRDHHDEYEHRREREHHEFNERREDRHEERREEHREERRDEHRDEHHDAPRNRGHDRDDHDHDDHGRHEDHHHE